MSIKENNIYSFDDCCILNLCKVPVPPSYRHLIGDKDKICSKNREKIRLLIDSLEKKEMYPFRFVPSNNLERNLLKVAENLIKSNIQNPSLMPDIFYIETVNHLKSFLEKIKNFKDISKSDNFTSVRTFFQTNERELIKNRQPQYTNIPEDDDCKILMGLYEHEVDGECEKHLITADEHFWRYSDLIESTYGILVVKEWECHHLI